MLHAECVYYLILSMATSCITLLVDGKLYASCNHLAPPELRSHGRGRQRCVRYRNDNQQRTLGCRIAPHESVTDREVWLVIDRRSAISFRLELGLISQPQAQR